MSVFCFCVGVYATITPQNNSLTAGGDDDGNDEAVDAQHTRHDDLDGGGDGCGGEAKVEKKKTLRPLASHPPFFHLLSTLTGTIDFMTSSGRMTPMDAMPTPDLAVP